MQRLIILASVLYITFIGGTAYTANNMVLRIFFHVVVSAAVFGWLLRREWPRTPFDLPLLVYALLLGITTLASTNGRVSLEQSWPFWMHILWFYMLVDIMRQGRQRWVFEALFMAGGVVVIISFVEFISWYFGTGFAGLEQGWFEIGGLSLPPQWHEISLALNLSTILGNYIVLLLPVTFAWGLTVRQADHRFGLWLLSLCLLGVLLGTTSRGGMAGLMGVGIVMGGFWLMRRTGTKLILAGVATLIFVLGAAVILFAFYSTSTSDQRRVDMWESAASMVKNDPLTGVGVYQFGTAYRDSRDKTLIQDKLVAAHNLWMNTAAEIGLPGLLVLFWLGGSFLSCWWQVWQHAGKGRKIRLEGILAALVGFNLHSLIDTFTLSASVLPILMFAAYTVAGHHTPFQRAEPHPLPRIFRYAVTALLAGMFIWLVRMDTAGLRYMNALVQISKEDYDKAREYLNRAKSLDPTLELYDLQDAYVLGMMANDEPEKYLDQAIQAHLDTLAENPTFDTGFANLAALYAQKGDFLAAADAMQQAVDIHPDLWQYQLKLAEYQEAAGQPEEALQVYVIALDKDIQITRSDYWNSHKEVLEAAYADLSPAQRTILAVNRNWSERAEESAAQIESKEALDYLALAHYALYAEDEETALRWYTDAIEKQNSNLPLLYAERAELHLKMGSQQEAEKDARTAIFLNPIEGARAYYVLAQLSDEGDQVINEYLIRAVIPQVIIQEYASAVYARPALLEYLPQLKLPGQGRAAYEPWFWLAERYDADKDEDTDPAEVYDAIQDSDPYLKIE